jgi:antitoxin YefM
MGPGDNPIQWQYAFAYACGVQMISVSATEARKCLYALIDEHGQSHEPVQINGKRGNAVLLSEEDWRAIQETLHLVSIPGMRESILEGMATDVSVLSPSPVGELVHSVHYPGAGGSPEAVFPLTRYAAEDASVPGPADRRSLSTTSAL